MAQANDTDLSNSDAHAQGMDGGLNLKTDPSRLAPPATTRSDNGWYTNPGNVQQLPALASAMQANTSHIYNIHARDLQQPSSRGDIMVHGEVRDASSSTTNLFTSSLWSDGGGATLCTQQPILPTTSRTRVMTGRMSVAGSATTDQAPMMIARQESGFTSTSPQRYALAYHNGSALNVTFGLVDGQIETPETLTVTQTAQYSEVAGIQNSANWVYAFSNSATLGFAVYDFKGNVVTALTNISTAALAYNSAASGQYAPFSILQHAGRTYIAYVTNPSGSNCVVTLYDVLSATSTTLGISSSSVPVQGFAVASPYGYTTPSGTFFLGVLFNNTFYTVAQTSVGATGTVVATSSALGVAANTGYASGSTPSGTVNYTATMSCCIFDTAGVGTTASLGFTIFRHYPEQVTVTGPSTTTFWYQQVSVDRFSFQANATTATSTGTLTSLGQNFFRTPSGAALCSKSFSLYPSEAKGAGLTAAKSAFAVVRCGGLEPNSGYAFDGSGASGNVINGTYGQPTYFIIDHQGRVVGRAYESQGPVSPNNALANNTYYYPNTTTSPEWGSAQQILGLSSPLISAPASDMSALDITIPCWAQTSGNPVAATTTLGTVYFSAPPANVIMQPGCISLSLSNSAATCPPVQAGSYTVLGGPLTSVHDGRGIVEANYHFGTHNFFVSVSTTTTSPGLGSPGTYYWSVVWEWYDSLGRVHRSTPSVPWPATVASGSYLLSAKIYCPQPVTAKSAVGGVMYAKLYRSVLNNTSGIFYLVSTTAISALASGNLFATLPDGTNAGATASFSDASTGVGANSTALAVQPRRYIDPAGDTALSVYASTPPPPFIWQVGTKGRCFGVAQVNGQPRLYYTSVAQSTVPFEWNSANYAAIPPDIGDVRSIDALDDKVLVFGTRSNAVMYGDGPALSNTLGKPTPSDGFSGVQPIPTPVGIIGSGAPARIPDGIVFQGYSGIQLIGRDLSVQPIGAAVDVITGRQINNPGVVFGRAMTLASLQSIVWCTPSGAPLVYNYLTQKWSTWPLLANASALVQRLDGSIAAALQPVSNGAYGGLATSSTVGADLGTLGTTYSPLYQGNNTAAGLVLESPWILPSGESGGESQVWDVTVTGGYIGPHILLVEQAYNYVSTYGAQTKFTVSSAPYIYQYRVRPKATGRIWAIRYRVSILPITTLSSQYAMASLGDLVLNYGTKQGTTRLGAAASG